MYFDHLSQSLTRFDYAINSLRSISDLFHSLEQEDPSHPSPRSAISVIVWDELV